MLRLRAFWGTLLAEIWWRGAQKHFGGPGVDNAPRLTIRKDIWILLSYTICQTQANHLQIGRKQCCLVKGVQTRDVRVREIGFIEDMAHPMLHLARSYDEFEHTNRNDVCIR